jgi:hypothetical protein
VSQLDSKLHPGPSRDQTESADDDPPGKAASGRPAFDRPGTTVWEWQTATGIFSRDASTTRVQLLQAPDLALQETVVVKKPEVEELRLSVAPCGGFNPYDHAPKGRNSPPVASRSIRRPPVSRPPPRPPAMTLRRPITLMERLRNLFGGK